MFLGAAYFDKPFDLCPLFCHEARPQDGLFGELKRMIDEDMTLGEAAALHIENWNFVINGPITHEFAHIMLGMACRDDPALTDFLPYQYNGTMISENIVVFIQGKIAELYRKGCYGRPLSKSPFTPIITHANEAMRTMKSDTRYSNHLLKSAWFMAGQSDKPSQAFEIRRQGSFEDFHLQSVDNLPKKIKIGEKNKHGELYIPLKVPTREQIIKIFENTEKPLQALTAIFRTAPFQGIFDVNTHDRQISNVLKSVRFSEIFAPPATTDSTLKVA